MKIKLKTTILLPFLFYFAKFQAKFFYALSIVWIDEKATLVENYVATRLLCYKFRISEDNMIECLNTIGCKCVKRF